MADLDGQLAPTGPFIHVGHQQTGNFVSVNSCGRTFIAVVVVVVATVVVATSSSALDDAVAYVWTHVLLPSPVFRHDSFEVVCSSALFALYCFVFGFLDYYVPSAHVYRIKGLTDSNKSWKSRYAVWFEETFWYVGPWLVIDYCFPRRHLLLAKHATPPTLPCILWDVAFSLVLYDFFFFLGHYVLHQNRSLYDTVHAKHHAMRGDIRAGDAVRHSFWDGTFDVACSIVALRISKAHPLSRTMYNAVAIYLITEAHAGYDFPYAVHNLFPTVFLGTHFFLYFFCVILNP